MFVKHKSRPAAKALDIFPSGWYILSVFGEMSERFKEPVLKTGDGATHRGFESHSLRHAEKALETYSRAFLLLYQLYSHVLQTIPWGNITADFNIFPRAVRF